MSSVKRRKVDGDVPSGLLKKTKKHATKEESPVAASKSPEPAPAKEPQEGAPEKEVKTFKDLVGVMQSETKRKTSN